MNIIRGKINYQNHLNGLDKGQRPYLGMEKKSESEEPNRTRFNRFLNFIYE